MLFLRSFFKYLATSFAFLTLTHSVFFLTTETTLAKEQEPEFKSIINQNSVLAVGKTSMVVTANRLASIQAQKALHSGGNAIDAAIVASLVLGVVEPQSSGLGGGGFAIVYDASNKNMTSFDGREKSPLNAKENMFFRSGKKIEIEDAIKMPIAVGVPSQLALLKAMHAKYGKLPWAELFKPAISIASNGFQMSPRLQLHVLESIKSEKIKSKDDWSMFFNEKGSVKQIDSIVQNKNLAAVLERLSKPDGVDYFYKGGFAQKIILKLDKYSPKSSISRADFAKYEVKTGKPICSSYRSYKICTAPSPSSGITMLETLNILENFDLKAIYSQSVSDFIKIISQALSIAIADRNAYIEDSKHSNSKYELLLNKDLAKQRASSITPSKVTTKEVQSQIENLSNEAILDKTAEVSNLSDSVNLSTTHISIVDKRGNIVSMTNSIEQFFGSGIALEGFFLNNTLTDFSFDYEIDGKKVTNSPSGGKKPRSSMSPTIIFDKDENPVLVLGSPGGSRITSYLVKTIVEVLDLGMKIDVSIKSPNFSSINDGKIEIENRAYPHMYYTIKSLRDAGNQVSTQDDLTSGVNAVSIINKQALYGFSDPRREGVAIGE